MTQKTISLKIELPYPRPELSPNRKNGSHWAKTGKIKDSCFDEGFYSTKMILGNLRIPEQDIPFNIIFFQADKRHRDLDNLLAASKAYLDGVSKALGVDDKHFRPITIDRGYTKSNPYMTLEITCNLS